MKVVLYYPWVYLTSGSERTILELIRRSRHDWTIYTNHFDAKQTYPGFRDHNVVELERIPVKRTIGGFARGAWTVFSQKLDLSKFDRMVVVCEGVGDLLLFRNNTLPTMCVCCTPLRLSFDQVYRERALSSKNMMTRLLVHMGSAVFRVIDRWAWKKYDHIFAISKEAKRRIIAGQLAPASEVEIINPGIGFHPEAPSDEFKPFFLIPGRIMWTKNIELGINAFIEFWRTNPALQHFKLVIAGIVDDKSQPYLAKLKELATGHPNVEFRIFPSDTELAELYRTCYGVVFTAFNEDWGIVPIEGMAFGKPVLAVNRGGPLEYVEPEVHGYLAPAEPSHFAHFMYKLASDEQMARQMGRRGFDQAQLFSWNKFVTRIDDELDNLACAVPAKKTA